MSLDAFVPLHVAFAMGTKQAASVSRAFHVRRVGAPSLTGDPTEEEWEAHDRWVPQVLRARGFLRF